MVVTSAQKKDTSGLKRRSERMRKPLKEGQRFGLNINASKELHEQLILTAIANHRSVTGEIEHRLIESFKFDKREQDDIHRYDRLIAVLELLISRLEDMVNPKLHSSDFLEKELETK